MQLITVLMFCTTALALSFAQESRPKPEADALQKLQALRQQRKKDTEAALAAVEQKIGPALALSIGELQLALQIKLQRELSGTQVFADDPDHTFLGTIEDEFAADSIFNQFGTHGSQFSAASIWNTFGQFGGQFSSTSAFNSFTSSPPLLIRDKRVIGRLTVNKLVLGAIDPNLLKSFFTH